MAYDQRQSRPMTAISINHVSIHAQDLERSAAFYERLSVRSDDWRAREQRLRDDSAFFSGMCELPDGSVQMYLRDPAGNLIEVGPDARTLVARIREALIPLSATVHQTSEARRPTLYLDRNETTTAGIHP